MYFSCFSFSAASVYFHLFHPHNLILSHFISSHRITSHLISCHLILSISSHLISSHLILYRFYFNKWHMLMIMLLAIRMSIDRTFLLHFVSCNYGTPSAPQYRSEQWHRDSFERINVEMKWLPFRRRIFIFVGDLYISWFKYHRSMFPCGQLTECLNWSREWRNAKQTTSKYLK